MANVGAKIVPNGSSYCVLINHSSDSVATNYNLNVNGNLYATNLVLNSALDISYGGTGATTAALARTNLGITPANIGAAASTHNHAAGDITSGTLGVARGGTGVTANPAILVNLASTATSAVFAAAPRPGVTGTLPLGNGGTGATTAALARTALGVKATQTATSVNGTSGITFIHSISQTAQGVISGNTSTVRDASDSQSGLINTSSQTFAGTKTFSAVISPDVTIPAGYIYFKETAKDTIAAMFLINYGTSATTDHRVYIREYSYNTDGTRTTYYDYFRLPTVAAAKTTNNTYEILTSKAAVTVAQGGTGSTTAAAARTALGITPANIGAKATQTATSGGTNNGIRFLCTFSQDAQGVVTMTDALVRDATTTSSGLVGTGTQYFAGEKHFNSGLHSYNNIRLRETVNNTTAGAIGIINTSTASNDHRLRFYEYSYKADGTRNEQYEIYYLPTVATNLSSNGAYYIWTSKDSNITSIRGIHLKETGKNTEAAEIFVNSYNTAGTNHKIYFKQYSYNTDGTRTTYYDQYSFPVPATAKTTNNSYEIMTTNSAVESAAITYVTNSHITSAQMSANMKLFKFGKVGMLVSTGASLAAYSYSGWVKIGTVPAAYKPIMTVTNRIPVSSTNWRIQIDTSGNVQCYKSTSDTTLFYCSFAYPLA